MNITNDNSSIVVIVTIVREVMHTKRANLRSPSAPRHHQNSRRPTSTEPQFDEGIGCTVGLRVLLSGPGGLSKYTYSP